MKCRLVKIWEVADDNRWEVEQDAMAWESAIGGMATMERQLRELRGLNG